LFYIGYEFFCDDIIMEGCFLTFLAELSGSGHHHSKSYFRPRFFGI